MLNYIWCINFHFELMANVKMSNKYFLLLKRKMQIINESYMEPLSFNGKRRKTVYRLMNFPFTKLICKETDTFHKGHCSNSY